ncbi:hypothetical protein ES703_31190 [subsurface metagenome]
MIVQGCGAAGDSPWTTELPVIVQGCGAAGDSPWTTELPVIHLKTVGDFPGNCRGFS